LAGRDSTIKAINKATETDKFIFLVSQIDPKIEEPSIENLYSVGTIAKILQVLRLPNGLIKVLVDGLVIAKSVGYFNNEYITAKLKIRTLIFEDNNEINALERRAASLFVNYINSNPSIPKETLSAFENIIEPER
jgi:ATP-dependent Lon protease